MIEDPGNPPSRIRAFTPSRRATDKSARRFRRGVYLLPSMFTLANMFSGYACIVYAMRGELEKAAPLIGLADGIVDLVATGRTLEENELEVREEILECTARFVANRVAHKLRSREVDDLTAKLREASER